MKHILKVIFFVSLIVSITNPVSAEEAPESVKKLVPTLVEWGKNPVLVEEVKKQNAKGMTLQQIQDMDKAWMAVTGMDDNMKNLMSNSAAKELLKLESSKPYFIEIFLMDNQGANVAMTNKTSDYWQGDEAKFKESFVNGAGGTHIGDVKFDKSAQAYLVQVSVPVMDGGTAIGALTIGINIDELEN